MIIPGQRFTRTRLIQTDRYVIAVDVEMVIPDEDLGEPCYEAETIKYLQEVKERAARNELTWLKAHGRVYEALDAA